MTASFPGPKLGEHAVKSLARSEDWPRHARTGKSVDVVPAKARGRLLPNDGAHCNLSMAGAESAQGLWWHVEVVKDPALAAEDKEVPPFPIADFRC